MQKKASSVKCGAFALAGLLLSLTFEAGRRSASELDPEVIRVKRIEILDGEDNAVLVLDSSGFGGRLRIWETRPSVAPKPGSKLARSPEPTIAIGTCDLGMPSVSVSDGWNAGLVRPKVALGLKFLPRTPFFLLQTANAEESVSLGILKSFPHGVLSATRGESTFSAPMSEE